MLRCSWLLVGAIVAGWPSASAIAQTRIALPDLRQQILKTGAPAPLDGRPERPSAPATDTDQVGPQPDTRTQYPPMLANSFLVLNAGFIHYPFSVEQLEPGHTASSVRPGRIAGQVVLFGHHFNEYVSAQAGYTRPVRYVTYANVNRTGIDKTVWMAFGEFTLRGRVPVHERVALYADAGLGLTSRRGFEIDGQQVVRDAQYASLVIGAGLEYQINRTWDVLAGVRRTPANLEDNQPRTLFLSGGIRYNIRPLTPERVEHNSTGGYVFPENVIQFGFSTSSFGYGVNNFFAGKVPIFWGGNVEVDRGWGVHYQRNLFHSRKRFAFDLGTSVARWKSRKNGDRFTTLSVYPLVRLTLLRTRQADWFVSYAPAGPSRMTRKMVDDLETGTNRFTFQDMMGMGIFAGRNRNVMFSVTIIHFSNGNLFPRNPGVSVPLTFSLGYTF